MELEGELGLVFDAFPAPDREHHPVLSLWLTYFETQTRHDLAIDQVPLGSASSPSPPPPPPPAWYEDAHATPSRLLGLLRLASGGRKCWGRPVQFRMHLSVDALTKRLGSTVIPLDAGLDLDLHSTLELGNAAQICYCPCIYAGSATLPLATLLAAPVNTPVRFDIEMRASTERQKRATGFARLIRVTLDPCVQLMSAADAPPHHRREESRQLLKLHKRAVMAPYVLNARGAFAARYDLAARSHVPRWITRWESVPTELFFTFFRDREPCYAFSEAFLVALMREALFLLGDDELDLADLAEAQFYRTSSTEFDPRFHRVVVLLCRLVSFVVQAMPYLPDGYYDARGELHSVDNFWDAWRTLSCDCEDCTRAVMQLLRGLQALATPRNRLLRVLQRTAALFVPIGCLGNATNASAAGEQTGSDDGGGGGGSSTPADDTGGICLHAWLVLDPAVRFEQRARRVHKEFRLPRDGPVYPWERSLEVCFVEGTGRIHPYLRPAREYLPAGALLDAHHRALAIRLSAFASFQEVWAQVRAGSDAPHRLLMFLVPEMVQTDHEYAGPGPRHTGQENSQRLFPFYRSLVDGYSDYLVQRGGRLARWTYVKVRPDSSSSSSSSSGDDWTYPVSVEEMLYNDKDVGLVFSMPLSDDVMRASRVVLEHTQRTGDPESLLAPRLHRPGAPKRHALGVPPAEPFSAYYDELEATLAHLPRAQLPALDVPYRAAPPPPPSSKEPARNTVRRDDLQYVDLFWNPDHRVAPAVVRAWCDGLRTRAWVYDVYVLRRRYASRLECFMVRVAIDLRVATLTGGGGGGGKEKS